MPRRQKPSIKRVILARTKGQRLYDPRAFLSPRRLDIAAKTVFARAQLESNTSEWPEYVYKEHIRAFNDFIEKEPIKSGYTDFRNSFLKTIKGVRDDDSWKHNAPVQRHGKYLVNGAHRIAASIAVGDKVNVEVPKVVHEDIYNYNYFRRDRSGIDAIDENVLDYMTIEYVSLKKKDIFVAIIFPAADGFRQEAYEHLLSLGEIVNMKTFKHDEFVGKEVIKQLYFNSNNDSWNYGLDFSSAKQKAELCFDGNGDLQVYVIEANLDESTRIKEKRYLRDLWKKDKHSIHITDTIEEANRIVRMFFHENSRNFLKIEREQEFASQEMYDMFNEYIALAPKDILERDKVVIEGGAVLDLLNIRPGRDIDYISRDASIRFANKNIERHGNEENKYHTVNVDEVTTNPNYYFFYKGFKFLDVNELQRYKQNRLVENNPKDANDLTLIRSFLRRNPFIAHGERNDITKLPLVSVIVPIFNTPEELLIKCLDCIHAQYYPNLQVILVDDGSDTKIAARLDEYVSGIEGKEGRSWSVIHQEHKGLASARNVGYATAEGVYVQFLDSDDYTYRRLIEDAVDRAELARADIVIENYTIRDFETASESVAFQPGDFPDTPSFTLKDIDGSLSRVPHSSWAKLFRKAFLDAHGLKHDEALRRAEDVVFSGSALVMAKRIAVLPQFYITYRDAIPGGNSKTNDKYPTDSLKAWKELYEFLTEKKKWITFKDDFETAMLESIYWHYHQLVNESNRTELAQAATTFFEQINISTKNDQYLTLALASSDHELINILDEKQKTTKSEIEALHQSVHAVSDELELLRKPGVKLAARKFAGAVKRKLKKTLKRLPKRA